VTFETGQIDILFVNDNSRSMSPEQRKMADAFSAFINSLGNLDFRIAMVTTDVAREQGRLVEFRDEQGNLSGERFLTRITGNLNSKFRGTISRQETLTCDNGSTPCPSDDERGIYAANLAVSRNEGYWMRNGAHLAIIALADEDQRSGTVFNSTTGRWQGINARFGDDLEELDLPETLVRGFSRLYSSKSMSFHSVIIRPGDNVCLNQQTFYPAGSAYPVRGSFGNLYRVLSQSQANGLNDLGQIVDGSVVDICASTYFSSLNLIGSLVSANANTYSIQMQCLPALSDISIEASQQVDYVVDTQERKILFRNLPFGVQITARWVCPNSV